MWWHFQVCQIMTFNYCFMKLLGAPYSGSRVKRFAWSCDPLRSQLVLRMRITTSPELVCSLCRSPLTLFKRSSRLSAMIPFFTLRSAFVTLNGLLWRACRDRRWWVTEALANTLAVMHEHVKDQKKPVNQKTKQRWTPSPPKKLMGFVLGERRRGQKAERLHGVVHLRAASPVTERSSK